VDYEEIQVADQAVEAHPEQTLLEETVDHGSDPRGNNPQGPVSYPKHSLSNLLACVL